MAQKIKRWWLIFGVLSLMIYLAVSFWNLSLDKDNGWCYTRCKQRYGQVKSAEHAYDSKTERYCVCKLYNGHWWLETIRKEQ